MIQSLTLCLCKYYTLHTIAGTTDIGYHWKFCKFAYDTHEVYVLVLLGSSEHFCMYTILCM